MDTYTDGELETFGLLQTDIQLSHGSKNTQTSPYGSLGIILMGLGIAKVDQETIPKELGDMSFIALNDFSADFLVCSYYISIVFWIK